jgi:hypothetical protein
VGAKGKVFAPTVTEVKTKIAGPVTPTLGHLEPKVTVTSAEERYLDGGHERFTRDGVRINISLYSPTSNELNLQYEASDGRDGFGATLTSAAAGTNRRPRPPVSLTQRCAVPASERWRAARDPLGTIVWQMGNVAHP